MDITNSDDLREKIHEIHNYMRNNGIGYGLTSLKVFNLFYGLMKIEEYGLNEKIGLNNETCKFSYLLKLVNEPNKKDDLISILYNETLEYIFNNENIKVLLGYNIPLDLKTSVYKYLINEINLIKDIEKSTKEQLSGKIYEYFVGRDQSAISELGAYFTNRGIVDFILNKIKPQLKPDGTIPKMIDMFGGSGGFTIGYMDYLIKNKFEIDWKSQLDNIYHFDINEDVLKSARLELFCLSEGIFPNINNVKRTNSFKEDFRDIGKFDIIMTNPPYGGDKIGTSAKKEKRDKIIKYIDNEIDIFKKYIIQKIESIESIKKKILEDIKKLKTNIDKIILLIKDIDIFENDNDKNNIKRIQELYNQSNQLKKENKTEIENNKKLCVNVDSCSEQIIKFAKNTHKITGTDKEACSLMLIMDLLEVNGTAVGVIKEGLFFDSSYMELRKVLLKNYNVKEIISVPQNQFENTSTKTSIIIFNNDGDIKTTEIKFSELKVNLYEIDEFIEIIQNDKIEIKLKHNKGDIINIEEVFIKSVAIDDILNNDTISLNSKDYNKVSIIPGEGFELVKLGDISDINIGSTPNTKNYNYWENGDIDWISISDFNDDIIINTKKKLTKAGSETMINRKIPFNSILLSFKLTIGKVAFAGKDNMYCNEAITYLNSKIKNVSQLYLFNILKCIDIKQFGRGTIGSNGSLSKDILENLEIPIPKTPELLEYWENKISQSFMNKQQKEIRLKELEEEIKNKIKDIQENHECEEVKLGDICKILPTTKHYTNIAKKEGKYRFYNSSQENNLYVDFCEVNNYSIILGQGGNFNIHIDKEFTASKHVCVLQLKITNNILLNYIYYIIPLLKHLLITNGSTISWLNKTNISNFKISIPKDKSLIDNLQPVFDEIEELQKEIKELNETYNNQLKELSKAAIINQEILNTNEIINEELTEYIKEIEEIQEETPSIKSTKSQTLEELKEQCKSLGIKGYSKKKKDELIELIKNHK
jgi:type I restriction-modification system DNA methylase subunit